MDFESNDEGSSNSKERQSDNDEALDLRSRKRPRCHPLHRRLLTIPTAQEWQATENSRLFDAYAPSTSSASSSFFGDIHQHRRRERPLPSSQILLSSTVDDNTHEAPILQEFFEAVGMTRKQQHQQDDANNKEGHDSDDDNGKAPQHDIDNPNLSQLTAGQHERYLKLLHSSLTTQMRKEFHTLSLLVRSEQERYRKALEDFHSKTLDKYNASMDSKAAGFPFVQWACSSRPDTKANTTKPRYTKFGKCRQNISLPQTTAPTSKSRFKNHHKLDLASLNLKVVHKTAATEESPTIDPALGLSIGRRIVPPKAATTPTSIPLEEDERIRALAREHNVAIVTTDETLQTLLKNQSKDQRKLQWMVPLNASKTMLDDATDTSSSIRLLGPPVPQAFATPRDCLERGLQEGLYQTPQQQQATKRNEAMPILQYVYTLWTLPSSLKRRTQRKGTKILIRSTIRCHNSKKQPLILRAHAEYFSDRQQEPQRQDDKDTKNAGVSDLPNSYERALWILDQLLFREADDGPQETEGEGGVEVQWVSVNAQTCQLVDSEPVSIAHALALEEDGNNDSKEDPIMHLECLIHILQSLSTIDEDEEAALLCCNANVVSVHHPVVNGGKGGGDAVAIDLEDDSKLNANGVLLNAQALKDCVRDWKWGRSDRVPHTFPVPSNKGHHSAQQRAS